MPEPKSDYRAILDDDSRIEFLDSLVGKVTLIEVETVDSLKYMINDSLASLCIT